MFGEYQHSLDVRVKSSELSVDNAYVQLYIRDNAYVDFGSTWTCIRDNAYVDFAKIFFRLRSFLIFAR